MKKKLTKAEWEKLSDEFKKLYSENNGEYHLDIEDDEDLGALKRAKEHEVKKRKESEEKYRELQKKLDELDATSIEDMKKKNDIASLEKSWNEKYTKREKELTDNYTKLQTSVKNSLIQATSRTLAEELSTVPVLMARAIADRLTVDFDADLPVVKIIDPQGKISAATIDDLKKEFASNKDFAAIIRANQASGGAGKSNNRAGSAESSEKPLSQLSPAELAAHLTAVKDTGV